VGEETTFRRRAKGLVEKHSKTAIGGIGGASIATVVAFVWPHIANITENNTKQWEAISLLKQRVVVLETKLDILMDQKHNAYESDKTDGIVRPW